MQTKWYGKAIESSTVQDLLWTSLSVALLVTVISMVVGFFGALAFARYQWRFRGVFSETDPVAYLFSTSRTRISTVIVV